MSTEPYRYMKLPTPRSIRLISFCSGQYGGHRIQINLTTYALDEAPPFVALSYTWGNPTSPFSKQAETAEIVYGGTERILLDGHIFEVRHNLLDALKMLRSLYSATEQYLWIDAICINQENLVECGAQVSIMSDIYGRGREVLVWLGQKDEFFADALYLLQSVGSVPVEKHGEVTLRDWFNQQVVFRGLGQNRAPESRHWLGLIAFLHRPFFERVWIVQEIILAKKVTVACGDETFPWELISNTIAFVITSGWEAYLTSAYFKGAISAMPGGDEKPSKYKKMMIGQNAPGLVASAIYLESTRSGINKFNNLARFDYLIEVFRSSKSSNPRDMVYALLSLARKDRPPFSTHPDVLVPDYEISVKDIFIKTARLMYKGTNDLRYLCHVEDRSLRKLRDLPSWVPDYTARLSPMPFYRLKNHGPSMHHNASKGVEHYQDRGQLTSSQLIVSGYLLSRIVEVPETFPVGIMSESPRDPGVAQVNDTWLRVLAMAGRIGEAQMKTLNPSVGRCEVLWRSICGNHIQKQYPAPKQGNLVFFRWLCIWCAARNIVWERRGIHISSILRHIGIPQRRKTWERFMDVLRPLFDQEPKTSEFQMSAFETLLNESVRGAIDWTDFEWFRPEFSDWWKDVNTHSSMRRYLLDSDDRFCVVPISSEKDDEIWIIGGAPEPYLLRKQTDETYTVVGQVYIHGIMDGELADMGLLEACEQIILV